MFSDLRNWSPVANTVGLGLGGMTVLEEICHSVGSEVKCHALFSVYSDFCLLSEAWALDSEISVQGHHAGLLPYFPTWNPKPK